MLRVTYRLRHWPLYRNKLIQGAISQCARPSRSYSLKPPVYKKSANILVNALNYVKDVEEYQEALTKNSVAANLTNELLLKISDQPELLFILLQFHSKLAEIGITASSSREFTTAQIWKYRIHYVMKLAQLHDIFWTQCRYLDISEREHKLGFLPTEIGVLDPTNFDKDAYEQLQRGVYNGLNFKHIKMAGLGSFE
ncbi:hypothetical protein METBIDRAFT_72850 [Metschnikowia bicuspidata var. bicuspidata NRRL YB-4993]|uniref:Uncharacterized protein n=1 Tax=Metschnikowia bicuspidata var. bicuspidata NRRL YB-4993 TaxID=869754 RepID=A0A1A0H7V2_9ASCO|nr:hypothetical protein METBIDRAFT_72850 [Metschnikowia bicuspidata var. bicuspidata NRRL YB-4993]OBA19978.1 hypothetical protein METBIDRAFT_72850 [Metschnikowia bicuspidata var. bicuspidata NRRL YB-4993]